MLWGKFPYWLFSFRSHCRKKRTDRFDEEMPSWAPQHFAPMHGVIIQIHDKSSFVIDPEMLWFRMPPRGLTACRLTILWCACTLEKPKEAKETRRKPFGTKFCISWSLDWHNLKRLSNAFFTTLFLQLFGSVVRKRTRQRGWLSVWHRSGVNHERRRWRTRRE